MPFDFPNAPTVGQTVNNGNATFTWDGAKWASDGGSGIYAPLSSPAFTGNPTAPTPAPGDNDTSIATTAFVKTAISASGGLPMSGGTMTGPVTFAATPATLSGSVIQALHDALPATGGMITLQGNATYSVSAQINITKPNVRLVGPSWATVLQRAPGMTGAVISVTGAGGVLENFTVDGNATVYDGTSHNEVGIGAANCLVDHLQIIKGGGSVMLALTGANSCARNCTVIGLGVDPSPAQTGYGIWAENGDIVKLLNNTVTGAGIEGIGFDGAGSVCTGNRVSGCHCYTGGSGGQITCAPTTTGAIIANNSVGAGGSNSADGIEVNGSNVVVSGNDVIGPQGLGIHLGPTASHILVDGNLVKNTGQTGVPLDGIYMNAGVCDFQIINNRVFDDRGTKFMRYAVSIPAGAGDRFVVRNNVLWPCLTYPFADASTGLDKVVGDNVGLDDVIASVASAATVTLPYNSVISLTGTTPITAVAAISGFTGRTLTIIPTAAASFVAGGNIANSITGTPGFPITATFDGTLWHFGPGSFLPVTSGGAVAVLGSNTAVDPDFVINGASGTIRRIELDSAGSVRWRLSASNTPEGGGNVGSDFILACYDNSGLIIASPFWIKRSNGQTTIANGLSISSGCDFGGTFASGVGDLSKHINLYNALVGFSVTSNRLNYVLPSGASHIFVVNAVDTVTIANTGATINQGALTVSTAGSGIVVGTGGPTIRSGTGAATGTQPNGSLWLRNDGTTGARLYVSAGGGTWAAVAGV